MEIQGRILKKSLAFYILEHLFHVGSMKRLDVSFLYSSMRTADVVRRKLRHLEDSGFIDVTNEDVIDARRISLTSKGEKALYESSEYYNTYKQYKVRAKNPFPEKENKEIEVLTLMAASSIRCYPKEKPQLLDLIKILTTMAVDPKKKSGRYWYPKDLEEFADRFGDGIYYSPKELRYALKKEIGAEQTYRSRFNGILVLPDRIYVIYHIGDGLIKFITPSEVTLLDSIMSLFGEYPIYRSPNTPSAIAIGNVSMEIGISQLVTGFKKGKIENKDSLENIAAQEAMGFFKANCPLFPEIFYIPYAREGIFYLKELITTTTESREQEAKEWFHRRKGYIYMEGLMETGIYSEENCKVEYLLYPETKKILMLRNALYPARIITSNYLAVAISKSVGPKAYDFVDLMNIPMTVPRYDIYGYKIDDVVFERTEEKKETTTINVNSRININLYKMIETDAKENLKSVSKTVRDILAKYYSGKWDDT